MPEPSSSLISRHNPRLRQYACAALLVTGMFFMTHGGGAEGRLPLPSELRRPHADAWHKTRAACIDEQSRPGYGLRMREVMKMCTAHADMWLARADGGAVEQD